MHKWSYNFQNVNNLKTTVVLVYGTNYLKLFARLNILIEFGYKCIIIILSFHIWVYSIYYVY